MLPVSQIDIPEDTLCLYCGFTPWAIFVAHVDNCASRTVLYSVAATRHVGLSEVKLITVKQNYKLRSSVMLIPRA